MRLKVASIVRARALARVVLPVPGTSSSSTWPPLAKAVSNLRVAAAWPRITLAMFAEIFSYVARAAAWPSDSEAEARGVSNEGVLRAGAKVVMRAIVSGVWATRRY